MSEKEEERTAIYYAYLQQIQNLPTLTLHSYTNIQYQKKLSVLKKSYPFIPDHTMLHNQGSVKDFIVPFFYKAIQIYGNFRTDAFGSGLEKYGRRMIHHIMHYAVYHIYGIIYCGRARCLYAAVSVATDIDNHAAALHPLQIFAINDVVGAPRIPKYGVDYHIIPPEFLTQQLFCMPVVTHHIRTHIVEGLDGSARRIASPYDCDLSIVGKHAVAHICMHYRSLACYLVVSPETVPPAFIHVFPRIGSETPQQQSVGDVTVLHRMKPAEDCLVAQCSEIFGIAHFRIAYHITTEDGIPVRHIDAGLPVVIIGVAQLQAITDFHIYPILVFYTSYMSGNQGYAPLILLMALWKTDCQHYCLLLNSIYLICYQFLFSPHDFPQDTAKSVPVSRTFPAGTLCCPSRTCRNIRQRH